MRLVQRLILAAAMLYIGSLATATAAEAYPQFQFSTENSRCTLCHFSPVGGGLINGWGRDESADTISNGGNGYFLYEAWEPPEWLSLGADFRAATGAHKTEATAFDPLLFPMQADLYSRAAFGDFTINITAGLRGAARKSGEQAKHSRVASREHYVMWQPESADKYVRLGRFYAPYGLRQADHTSYTRRDLGFYAFEETYGLSGGLMKDEWEIHLSAFTRDPILQVGPAGSGASVLYERKFREDTAAWGLQSKLQLGPDSKRYWAGGVLKYWFESIDVLLLSEVNIGLRTIDTAGADPILEGIAHLNLSHFVATGWMLGTTLEAKQTDISLAGKDAESASLHVQYFPRAHWEIMALGRAERTRQTRDFTALLMAHYYL